MDAALGVVGHGRHGGDPRGGALRRLRRRARCSSLDRAPFDESRALLVGVLAGAATLALFALGERILVTPALDPYPGSLLKEPVGYANALGMLMALGLVLAVGLMLEETAPVKRFALAGAAGVSAVALLLTSSRGAWLAAFVGLGVLLAYRMRSARAVAAIAVTAAIAALVVVAPRVSFGDRPAYWRVAISDASDHVLLGSGAGSFDDVWLERRPIPAHVRDAHQPLCRHRSRARSGRSGAPPLCARGAGRGSCGCG